MVPQIIELVISPEVAEHIWERHHIDAARLTEILLGDYDLERNRRGRSATHLLIGEDLGGSCYIVPVKPTGTAQVWEVYSAWPCD
jgi:hypothetical protein